MLPFRKSYALFLSFSWVNRGCKAGKQTLARWAGLAIAEVYAVMKVSPSCRNAHSTRALEAS